MNVHIFIKRNLRNTHLAFAAIPSVSLHKLWAEKVSALH